MIPRIHQFDALDDWRLDRAIVLWTNLDGGDLLDDFFAAHQLSVCYVSAVQMLRCLSAEGNIELASVGVGVGGPRHS